MRLRAPEEPPALRAELRRLAGERPARARDEVARRLAALLWECWAPALREAGAGHELVRDQVGASAYETWLWVMGDRRFEDLADSLAGRVARRIPVAHCPGQGLDRPGSTSGGR